MKNKNIIVNFFYQASYQLLVVLLPIITVPIVSRALHPSGVGTWNYVNSIVSYFTLIAGLGLSSYGVREIAFVRNDKKKLSKKFWEIELFNIVFSSFVLVIYILFSFYSRYSKLFFLQTLTVLATLLDISWFFQGIEDFKRVSEVNIGVKLLTFILTVVLVRNQSDLPVYVGILGLSSFISGVTFWFFLKNKITLIKIKFRDIWSHFYPALSFFVIKAASTLFNNLNKTILGLMTTMSVVGIFSNSLVLIMMITTIFNSLNTVLLPRMSAMQMESKESEMLLLLSKAINVQVFMTVGCMFITLGIMPGLVGWFFGSSFSQVSFVVPILAPVMLLGSIQQAIANMYLVPKNKIASYTTSILIGTIINVLLCVALIPNFQAFGAAIGYTAGQTYLAVSRVYILSKETNYVFNYKYLIKCTICGLFSVAAVFLLSEIKVSGFFLTVIQGSFGLLIYLVLSAVLKVNPIKSIFPSRN